MDSERYKFQGRLAEKDNEKRKLEVKIDGLRRSLRDLLDPIAKHEELDGELIGSQALEMANVLFTYGEVLKEIALIKRQLGR